MNVLLSVGTRQASRWLQILCFLWTGIALVGTSRGQNAEDEFLIEPTAKAADVRNEGQLLQEIRVFFDWRRSVARATLGDGDITVTGPLGYSQRARFLSVEEVPGPLALPIDMAGNGEAPDPDAALIPQPVPMLVATYRVFPSDTHDGPWGPEQNGPYSIYLNAGEVTSSAGEFYAPALIGGFRVALGASEPVLPSAVSITIGRESMVSPNAAGIIEAGETYHALVDLLFAEQNVEVSDWGTVVREGNAFHVTVKASRIPGAAIAEPNGNLMPPRVFSHRYPLGALPVGDYRFVVRAQDQRIGLKEFRVEEAVPLDEAPPTASIAAGTLTQGGETWHDLRVVYEDASGVDPGSLDAGDLRVFNASRCEMNAGGLCAESGRLPLVFVEAHPTGADLRRVEALYRVGPPRGGWTPDANGFYTIVLEDAQVCDLRGNCNHLRALGGFQVAIQDAPPIPGTAFLRVNAFDSSHVTARVEVILDGCFAIASQSLRLDGNRFVLSATSVPTPCAPPQDPNEVHPPHGEVLEFDLGAPAPGVFVAVFLLNERQIAAVSFTVGGDPPVPAIAAVTVSSADPARVVANVHVDFLGHFAVTGQSIRRQGSTIYLDAKAEEQAIIAVFPPPPPSRADLVYEIGPLPPGAYKAVFVLNGRRLAEMGFPVGQVPPVPAMARIVMDASNPSHVVADVTVQFGDHYRVVSQAIRREANRFILVAVPEGPLPLGAPIPPPPVTLHYELGAVEPGQYASAFIMREHVYAATEFKVEGEGEAPFAAAVALAVDTKGAGVVLHAVVDFEDPFVVLVDPGTPQHDGRQFSIQAVAARANFFAEPDGAPVTYSYELGTLEAGSYSVVYRINGEIEARLVFIVEGPPRPPVPHVAFIEIHEGNASHFAEVGIVLERPDWQVLEWGELRREGNGFVVEIAVGSSDIAGDPAGDNPDLLPDGFAIDADGNPLVGGFPVRLVSHHYDLGILSPGEYAFTVTSQGDPVARKGFVVRGLGPVADLHATDIAEGGAESHRFSVHYSDPDGLNHDALRTAAVTVSGPDGFAAVAELLEYQRSANVPSTEATAVYTLGAPGGRWNPADNGRYRVAVDAAAVRDRLGNSLAKGALGFFDVRIHPEIPGGHGTVAITAQLTAMGEWVATVGVLAPGVTVTNWGEVARNGQVFLAKATAVRIEDDGNPPGAAPETHTYRLGELGPGHYRFVFKTSLGHCGQALIEVPGIPRDPVDNWIDFAGGERKSWNAFEAFAFALPPDGTDAPLVSPEIITGADQREHLGLRFRRLLGAVDVEYLLECSADMRTWYEAGESAEIVNRAIDIDGTETVHICLRASIDESAIRYLRVVARRIMP
jgi:hypothetical protein